MAYDTLNGRYPNKAKQGIKAVKQGDMGLVYTNVHLPDAMEQCDYFSSWLPPTFLLILSQP